MNFRLTRRAIALLPLLLAACADDEPPRPSRRDFPPLRYGYLPSVNLNVQRVAIGEAFVPPASEAEVSDSSPAKPASTSTAVSSLRLRPPSNQTASSPSRSATTSRTPSPRCFGRGTTCHLSTIFSISPAWRSPEDRQSLQSGKIHPAAKSHLNSVASPFV